MGEVSPEALRLIEVTHASLDAAIEVMLVGNRLGDIGHAVSSVAEAAGLSVVDGCNFRMKSRKKEEKPWDVSEPLPFGPPLL